MKLPTEYLCSPVNPTEYGGRFRYKVHKVPVFTEHEREHGGKVHKIDKQRLFKFAQNLNKLYQANNWMPAVHEEHHDRVFNKSSKPRLAMVINPVIEDAEIADINEEGEVYTTTKAVLYTDWLVEDDYQKERLQQLPYRSAEVDLEKDLIGSIACIQSRETFFKFPLFNFAKDSSKPGAVAYEAREDDSINSLVGLAVAGSECMAFYSFPKINYMEDSMKDEQLPPEEDKGSKKDQLADQIRGLIDEAMAPMKEQFASFMEEAKAFAKPSYVEEGLEEQDEEKDPVVMSTNHEDLIAQYVAEAVGQVMQAQSAQYAAMDGRIASALSRIDEHNKKAGIDAALLWAKKQTARVVTPPDFDDKVTSYAAHNSDTDDAGSALVAYVSAIRDGSPDLPAEQLYDVPEVTRNDPAEIADYAGDARAMQHARRMNSHFDVIAKSTPGLAAALGHNGRKKFIDRAVKTVPVKN